MLTKFDEAIFFGIIMIQSDKAEHDAALCIKEPRVVGVFETILR